MSVQVQDENGISCHVKLNSRRFLDFQTSVSSMDVCQLWYFDCRGDKVVLGNDDDFAVFLENESPKTTVYIAQLQQRKRIKRYHHLDIDHSLPKPCPYIVTRKKSNSSNNPTTDPTKTIRLIIDGSSHSDEVVSFNPFQDGNFDKLSSLLKEQLGPTQFRLYYIDRDKDQQFIEDDNDLMSLMKEVGIPLIIRVSITVKRTIKTIVIVVIIDDQNRTETVNIDEDHPRTYKVLYDSVAKIVPHCGFYIFYHDRDKECIILEDDNDFQNFLKEVKPPQLHVARLNK